MFLLVTDIQPLLFVVVWRHLQNLSEVLQGRFGDGHPTIVFVVVRGCSRGRSRGLSRGLLQPKIYFQTSANRHMFSSQPIESILLFVALDPSRLVLPLSGTEPYGRERHIRTMLRPAYAIVLIMFWSLVDTVVFSGLSHDYWKS